GCTANAEIFNFVTFAPAVPTGTGPFFGLSIVDSQTLFIELTSPLGTAPFHVLAPGSGTYDWGFTNGPLAPPLHLSMDVVTVRWGAAGYGGSSNVVNLNATF